MEKASRVRTGQDTIRMQERNAGVLIYHHIAFHQIHHLLTCSPGSLGRSGQPMAGCGEGVLGQQCLGIEPSAGGGVGVHGKQRLGVHGRRCLEVEPADWKLGRSASSNRSSSCLRRAEQVPVLESTANCALGSSPRQEEELVLELTTSNASVSTASCALKSSPRREEAWCWSPRQAEP